jgi:hypothetical protein
MSTLNDLLDDLADRLAARVAERLRGGEPGMVEQTGSPLGNRRHCSAVKRRLQRGEPGAAIVGRRHLLAPEALSEELARASHRDKVNDTAPGNVRAELESELRLLRRKRASY